MCVSVTLTSMWQLAPYQPKTNGLNWNGIQLTPVTAQCKRLYDFVCLQSLLLLFCNANSNSIHISTFPTASIDDGALVPYCRLSCTTQIIKSNHVKMTVSDKLKKIKINKKSSKYVGIWAGCLHNGSTWFCSNIRSHVAIPAGTSLAPRVVYNLFVQWNNPARVQATPQAIIDITDNAHLGFQTVIVSFSLLLLSDLENR